MGEQGKIKKKDNRVDAFAKRMVAQVKATEAQMAKTIKAAKNAVQSRIKHSKSAEGKMLSAALKFVLSAVSSGEAKVKGTYIKKYMALAGKRAEANVALSASAKSLNDALAKQAALMDSRFSKTVKDLASARKQASDVVVHLRKDFATQLARVTAEVQRIETLLINTISVVTGEIISLNANKYRVDGRVDREIKRTLRLANEDYSTSKRAKGTLKVLLDENKRAAADEVTALSKSLLTKIDHARTRKFRSVEALKDDLSESAESLYEKMAGMQKSGAKVNVAKLKVATSLFKSKVIMLADAVAAGYARSARDMEALSGVTKEDKELTAIQVGISRSDLNGALIGAIMMGEARGKAVEQRLAEHLKHVKRYLQVELAADVDREADAAFAGVQAARKTIADNYLSLKAYAVTVADKITDTVSKGQYLSSIGDLLQTIGGLGDVKPLPAYGIGMGAGVADMVFSGDSFTVPAKKAVINGLVNEYTDSCKQVHQRWPLGLGKYLMDRLEVSMMDKGVLEVDKVPGKNGNFVYINAEALGLSSHLGEFAGLAAQMSDYESALAHLTATLTAPTGPKPKHFVKPPEWQGD